VPESDPQPVLSASQALRFIADAAEVLSSSLDYAQTLQRVAQLAVPDFADWCAVYILGDGDAEVEVSSGHEDPQVEAMLLGIRRTRRDVDGASESRQVGESGKSILMSDVRVSPTEEVDEGLYERLAPKSYMLVPLFARGRSLGSMTLLSTRDGRHYGAEDLAFAETLAGRCALAIDNARLHDAAERSLTLLDSVFATAPVGLEFVDRDLQVVRSNDTMTAYREHLGALDAVYRSVVSSGRPVLDLQLGGSGRHWNVSCAPVRDAGGALLGVTAVVLDVTERQQLLDAEREARARADFLARAGVLLDETLDYERTLRSVADIAVPEIADWCGVSVLDSSGALQQVAAAHVDPEQRALGEELTRRFPPERDTETGTMRVARTGTTEFVPEITEEMLVAGVPDPDQLALVRRLDLRSIIISPLRAHSRTFGTLTLANTGGSRLFDHADIQLAEELARRAATAIDNARLYTERTHIAHTLQARLLPSRLPDIPGALLAARYRAAGELNEVGGDFYDVFPRSPSEWAMVVGDVSGKGPEAAAVTALARYTLRAGALEDDAPPKALRRLNGAMRAQDDNAQFATAALAYLSNAAGDQIKVRLSLAGHPPAMVVRRDGTVEGAGRYGDMLALDAEPAFHETELLLGRGDVLLLYTDGVTEAGPRGRPFGDFGFAELLATLAGEPPQAVVDAVEEAVVSAHEGEPRDDIALLALGLAS
jgi:serine phosphatase RsbU (regulator of sigma subunit)/PAS domain-containing protein